MAVLTLTGLTTLARENANDDRDSETVDVQGVFGAELDPLVPSLRSARRGGVADEIPVESLAGTPTGEPEDGQATGGDGGLPVAVSAPDGSVSRECGGDGFIEQEITRVFGAVGAAGQACRVAACESGRSGDTGNLDGNWASSGSSFGVFQINQIHAARFPEFWERWFEVEYNVMMAHTLFVEHGYSWSAWSCRSEAN